MPRDEVGGQKGESERGVFCEGGGRRKTTKAGGVEGFTFLPLAQAFLPFSTSTLLFLLTPRGEARLQLARLKRVCGPCGCSEIVLIQTAYCCVYR